MEWFYAWFQPYSTPYTVWTTFGFFAGFLLLLAFIILPALVYYVLIGNKTSKYSTTGHWALSMLIAALLVFISSVTVIGFNGFENTSFANIQMDVWKFSLVNGFVYTPVFYTLLSGFVFNQFSLMNRYVPFNFFR